MRPELQCGQCLGHFTSPRNTPLGQALEQLALQGPWQTLGDGETLEDQIFASLSVSGDVRCPCCHADYEPSEEALGALSRELLAQW